MVGEPDVDWHRCTVAQAYGRLRSGPEGLTTAEAAIRRERYGPNALEEAPRPSPLSMFVAQFADFMVLVLLGAAVVSGLVGDLVDTAAIAAIVVLNACLGFAQEYRAERALQSLKALAAPTARVLRDGQATHVAASALVLGDLVLLEAGCIVPADLRLVESACLRTDESALTGESNPVDKSSEPIGDADVAIGDRRNIAHKGSIVTYGRAVGIVVATGMHTELGRIARMLGESRAARTPLQRRLATFGRRLAIVVLLICAVVFMTGLLRGEPALPMLLIALSLAVAAIPEALPAVVSISLTLGARKMVANHALVRRLSAVETLGSVTHICADKTGTLTTNEMRVDQYYCDATLGGALGGSTAASLLLDAMAVSHDAVADSSGRAVGDPTEIALLRAAAAAGIDVAAVRVRWPRIGELPFDPERKCMSTWHARAGGGVLSITKGAAEVIVSHSDSELRATGREPVDRERLARIIEDMAGRGLRVLGIGVRQWTDIPPGTTADVIERRLEFVGLVGLLDPPRPEVREAIATCRRAGIVPVMITGDHPVTARAIARRLGLLERDDQLLTGAALADVSPEDLESRAREIVVYARVAPEQKVDVVRALQAGGAIVAMTGDGVNDAPALGTADVGVAMGFHGTDVAREAASIVLLDDNFATIVQAVREGRRIYDNLRRFVRYVLTTNSAEIWTLFLAPFLGLPVPLSPIQILWLNLVTDGLPGLALASEPAERDVMRRPPRAPTESLFARGLGAHAFLVGLLMAALTLGVEAWLVQRTSPAWQTALFTTLCFTQLAHVLAIRSESTSIVAMGVQGNPPLAGAVLLTVALQLAVVYVPSLQRVFGTVPLSATELAVCAGCALVVLATVEVEKAMRRRR